MKTQITRLKLCGLLGSLAINLIMVGTGRAASRPLSIEELQDKADFVVIGTVRTYHAQIRPALEYEERTYVQLDVTVEVVEKGSVKVGDSIRVGCWRLTRHSFLPLATDSGQRQIPAVGSRARFFMNGESAFHPNGIEVIDGGAFLHLPMRSPWTALLEWPLLLIPTAGLALIGITTAMIYRRKRMKREVAGRSSS